MLRTLSVTLTLALAAALPARGDVGVSLRGSRASMERQNEVARESAYTFLRTPAQVREFVEKGRLVRLEGNRDYQVARGVSFPYGRPELATFVERLGAQYREGCGERMVVTSVTRPRSLQPSNAHDLSVHPAGMAADLRIPRDGACRRWLEGALLSLERKGLLDVTRERNPPHYHVAVFPDAYRAHVERLAAAEQAREAAPAHSETPAPPAEVVRSALAAEGSREEGSREGNGPLVALTLTAAAVALRLRRLREGPGEAR